MARGIALAREIKKDAIKETGGKDSLTRQVRDYLKLVEKIYPIYAVRNHQGLGSDLGRPDYEIGFLVESDYRFLSTHDPYIIHEVVYIELKSPRWRGKLNKYQQSHKERIERAGGEYHIITSIDQLHQIFLDRGYDKLSFQPLQQVSK